MLLFHLRRLPNLHLRFERIVGMQSGLPSTTLSCSRALALFAVRLLLLIPALPNSTASGSLMLFCNIVLRILRTIYILKTIFAQRLACVLVLSNKMFSDALFALSCMLTIFGTPFLLFRFVEFVSGSSSSELSFSQKFEISQMPPCNCGGDGGIGSRVGGFLGSVAGTALESAGRTAFASFFGAGDYTLQSNSLVLGGGATMADNLQITSRGNHEVRIAGREFLGDVYTNPNTIGEFANQPYSLNPGTFSTFPWLSTIAQQYEQWIAYGIVFEFKSTSTEFSATTVLGSVMMATEYNPYAASYATKAEMMNSAYASEAKPSQHLVHGVECAPNETPNRIKFVRAGNISDIDRAETDLGKFQIATQGSSAPVGTILGSLYIHYDIGLLKQQVYNGIPNRGPLNSVGASSTPTNAAPFTGLTQTGGNYQLAVFVASGNVLRFPNFMQGACWAFFVSWVSSSNVVSVIPTITPTGCTVELSTWAPLVGTNTSTTSLFLVVRQTSNAALVTFSAGGTIMGTSPTCRLQVMQLSDKYNVLY